MHHIYKNSYLNLVAAAATDATGGLFRQRNPLSTVPCIVKIGGSISQEYGASQYTPEVYTKPCTLPAMNRAWIFQEWVLAPRALLFGKKELFWQCQEMHGTETCPAIRPEEKEINLASSSFRKNWRAIKEMTAAQRWELWNLVIEQYSAKEITKSSDKLVAVAGLASEMGGAWDSVDYLAGMWSYRLRRSLLWVSEDYLLGKSTRQTGYIAPSWSWASMAGHVNMNHDYRLNDGLVEVLDASLQYTSPLNPYGAMTSGYIRLKGPLVRAKIAKVKHELELSHGINRPHWEIRLAIDSDEQGKEEEEADELSPRMTIQAKTISWDDQGMDNSIEVMVAYLVPFEVSFYGDETDASRVSGLKLEGLILLPTHLQDGQYRRLGCFKIVDEWIYQDEFPWVAYQRADDGNRSDIPNREDVSNKEDFTDDEEFTDDEDCQELPLPEERVRYRTALEIEDRSAELKKEIKLHITGPMKDRTRLQRMQQWMQLCDTGGLEKTEGREDIKPREDDRFFNGVVDTQLWHRYGEVLSLKEYHNIGSFLIVAFAVNEMDIESEAMSSKFYEHYHGECYFTFQIV